MSKYRRNNVNPQLLTDLHRVLREQKFDLVSFQQLNTDLTACFGSYITIIRGASYEERSLTQKEKEKAEEIKEDWAQNYNSFGRLLNPVVERMGELGYPPEELIAQLV